MAVTFRGSCATQYMLPARNAACFVLEVSARARCNVNVLRLVMQFDAQSFHTASGQVMPLIKARKYTGTATGGVLMTGKVAWDTQTNAPDAGVLLRVDPGLAGTISSDITITGTPRTMSQQFSTRMMTGAEQFQTYDALLACDISGSELQLKPGELLEIYWSEAGANSIGGIAFLQVAWEEDQVDAGYTVGGSVTLGGSAVSGAKVMLVTDLDRDMPDPQLEVLTTGAPGTWSKTLASGVKANAFVQARTGETLYTSEGRPYLAKP